MEDAASNLTSVDVKELLVILKGPEGCDFLLLEKLRQEIHGR